MKKIFVILTIVVALAYATHRVDVATRVKAKSPASSTVSVESVAGTPAPDVIFKDLDGKDVPLSSFKGKVVLINFWATWCEPCYIEIPWLIEMQQKYGAQGFTVLGVSMDDEGKAAVAPFLAKERFNVNGQKLPMNYPIVLGNDDVATKFGGLLGYPTSFLISKDGKEIKKIQGLIPFKELTETIESQL
jgi:cytochrome c biogenesis protein CcmG/thiol:disulfide interchange protein DsbE